MKLKGIFENQVFKLAVIIMAVTFVVTTAINIFLIGGIDFVSSLDTVLPLVFSLLAAITFIFAWWSTHHTGVLKRVMGLLALGLSGWAIAEFIWLYAVEIQGIELPYPSIADAIWLAGYLPMYAALYLQYQTVRSNISNFQRYGILSLGLLFFATAGYFVIWPIVSYFDPQAMLESILNILYPLMDVFLFILTVLISFSLVEGRFSTFWKIIAVGFIIMTLSDLVFSYAVWNETYWPDGQINAITIVIDVSYMFSYLVLALGAYTYTLIRQMGQSLSMKAGHQALTRSRILIIVGMNGRVFSFSENFKTLMNSRDVEKFKNQPLTEVLGIENEVGREITDRITSEKAVSNYPLSITDGQGQKKDVWLTALPHDAGSREFSGANIVLLADLDGSGPAKSSPANEEMEMMARFVLEKTGVQVQQDMQILRSYFLEKIRLIYALVNQYSGEKVADNMLQHLSDTARLKSWDVHITNDEVVIPDEFTGQALADCLSKLLLEARQYASNMTSNQTLNNEIDTLDQSLSKDAFTVVTKYKLRLSRQVIF